MQIIEQNDKDLHRFETFENHVFHPFPSFKILILISLPPPSSTHPWIKYARQTFSKGTSEYCLRK